jgi:hypothetical protein
MRLCTFAPVLFFGFFVNIAQVRAIYRGTHVPLWLAPSFMLGVCPKYEIRTTKYEVLLMKLRFSITVPNWIDRIFTRPLLTYRRLRFGYPFRRIRLIEGKFAIVDPADFYRFNSFIWLTCGSNGNPYAARLIRMRTGWLKTVVMHKEILDAPPGLYVDHRNTNSLDNRRANLRLATPSQNCCNSRRDKSHTHSRFRGVSFNKRAGKWYSSIRFTGKRIWLGLFVNEIDAAKAYDNAAREYHKDFARLNFPEA